MGVAAGVGSSYLSSTLNRYHYEIIKTNNMRIIAVNIGTTKIEFYNSMWTGVESIYANGELVSKKFSFLGADHAFDVAENGELVHYVLTTGIGWMGATTELTRNGVPIIETGGGERRRTIHTSKKRSLLESEYV